MHFLNKGSGNKSLNLNTKGVIMRKKTLEKMQIDSNFSDVDRMAAGALLETRKRNGHRDLKAAAKNLKQYYGWLDFDTALDYVTDVANIADDREWTG